jgi:hypothetical protein
MRRAAPITPFLILLSLLALLTGLWAGLLRLGWSLPGIQSQLPIEHGPLMVSGFLGSLIILERVVALNQKWMFLAPLLSGIGWITALVFPQAAAGAILITSGSLLSVIILGFIVAREPASHTITMAIGALCWLVGNLLWVSGLPIFRIVLWWMGFLVLTVSGERLELSRVLRPTRLRQMLFVLAAGLFLAGILSSLWSAGVGARLAGVGLLALSAWMIRYDIARRNLHHRNPLTRYIAVCLFSGYIWMGIGGVFNLWYGATFAGLKYDIVLHTIFIGFVLSMIFGHAPIILPALIHIAMPYHRVFYLNLILLHVSLLIRVIGDLGGWLVLRRWGGLLNEVAVLSFLVVTAVSMRQAKTRSAVR